MKWANAGHRRRPDRGRGAVLVEFALIAPLLFALILGCITGGLTLSIKNSMSNASREGSRLGATVALSTGNWATSVRNRVREVAGGDLTNNQICVRLVNSSGTTIAGAQALGSECSTITPPALPTGVSGTTQCVVLVWAHRTSNFETIFFSRTVNLDVSTVARYERGTGSACT